MGCFPIGTFYSTSFLDIVFIFIGLLRAINSNQSGGQSTLDFNSSLVAFTSRLMYTIAAKDKVEVDNKYKRVINELI